MSKKKLREGLGFTASKHICVVAKMMTPNLSPILDRRLQTQRVILIHTPDFLAEARRLAEVYRQYQVETEFFQISSAFDFLTLRKELEPLFLRLVEESSEDLPAVNLTSGTKVQSLVLHELASALEFPAYYMYPNDSIVWLSPKDRPALQLEDRMKLPAFLRAHGWEVVQTDLPSSDKSIREMLEDFVLELEHYHEVIPQLNGLALAAKGHLEAKLPGHASQELLELLDKLQMVGLLNIEEDKITFKDEEARFFVNGGWLEAYVHHQIRRLSSRLPEIQDYLTGTNVSHLENKVKNEIDNLVLANNHLFVIECKTKTFKAGAQNNATGAIYKLETLMHQLGGNLARAMLVSIYPVTKSDRERAKHYGIEIVEMGELKQLNKKLTDWISEVKFV